MKMSIKASLCTATQLIRKIELAEISENTCVGIPRVFSQWFPTELTTETFHCVCACVCVTKKNSATLLICFSTCPPTYCLFVVYTEHLWVKMQVCVCMVTYSCVTRVSEQCHCFAFQQGGLSMFLPTNSNHMSHGMQAFPTYFPEKWLRL